MDPLDQAVTSSQSWNREDREKRSSDLAELALTIWPYFGDGSNETEGLQTVTGTTPHALTESLSIRRTEVEDAPFVTQLVVALFPVFYNLAVQGVLLLHRPIREGASQGQSHRRA